MNTGPCELSRQDRALLDLAGRLVPCAEREEWHRAWEGELWHERNRDCNGPKTNHSSGLSAGLIRDALWLRFEGWKGHLRGTALLCLVWLAATCIAGTLLAAVLEGGWQLLALHLHNEGKPSLVATPLVLFVAASIAPKRPAQLEGRERIASGAKQLGFLALKAVLLLCTAFILSMDLCSPLALSFPDAAEFLQVLLFVLLATFQLRWAFHDQESRCQECLRLLAAPTRVGRPSHNLLEWNGVQIACTRGHGHLSVPELETSWSQSSEWIREA